MTDPSTGVPSPDADATAATEPVVRLVPVQLTLQWYRCTFGDVENDLAQQLATYERIQQGSATMAVTERLGTIFAGGALNLWDLTLPEVGPFAVHTAARMTADFPDLSLQPEFEADISTTPLDWMTITLHGEAQVTWNPGDNSLDAEWQAGVRFEFDLETAANAFSR